LKEITHSGRVRGAKSSHYGWRVDKFSRGIFIAMKLNSKTGSRTTEPGQHRYK
jgi:hypothetical protein